MGVLFNPPLIISLHQSGVYGQPDPHLTPLLQPNFEVGVLLPANSGIKHFHQFVQIYTLLTSKNPQPQITEECPTLYLNGLEFAIQDAQRSVDFYLEIADEATDQQIKEVFRRVAADEQNHAVWFLYYFSKQNKK
ncbi:hypothetical protein CN507_21620 [Bacillus cereus]|nr:hypothetical protein COM83_05830 [Bacillus cereus]PEQ42899.1 hypothetical protein CN467_03510 [Bacillus cereus]PES63496.1 hypothetical protein CN507_21620 [Bacillus cereus]PFM39251.1 hypothetical protein COJ42_04000 [Bacillus cereus]PGK85641.1 hypothetical protein CN924_02485 [Bacillus cereus]